MGKIKIAKKIDFLVTENVSFDKDCVVQTYQFWTSNKKYLHYAFDHRFCLFTKLEKLYKKDLLDLEFIKREDHEDKVVFKYKADENIHRRKPKTINCEFYLPPYNGCKYCKVCKQEGDFLYCETKKKHYDLAGIKNCPVFKSIDEIIS